MTEVFTDDVSGKATSRLGMQSMLGFLHMNACTGKDIVVIIDDISRLARGLTADLELRQSLAKTGRRLESPSIEFSEDSDSILVENLLASAAQHQREKNSEQTANRMKGRMMNGYSVFTAPVGFKYEKRNGHGKLLVRDEPEASIVQEVLEGYAAGRFAIQAEVKRYFEAQPAFPKISHTIRQQEVSDLFNRVLDARYIEHDL
ncbi:MAG: recombinase family protein [Roseobacter sp.]